MTEESTLESLEGRLNAMAQNALQQRFELMVKTLPHLACPPKILNLSDAHAGNGEIVKGNIDPLMRSHMDDSIQKLLDDHADYFWVLHEMRDIWRGYSNQAVERAHPDLFGRIQAQKEKELCAELRSNHVLGDPFAETLPEAVIFEGYGKKLFFFHGHQGDWPNDEGWKIGRSMVRMADKLGVDPESSPHESSSDRHAAVRALWLQLATDNPKWLFFCGHSHFFEQNKYYNSGSPITGKLTWYEILDGKIIAKEG